MNKALHSLHNPPRAPRENGRRHHSSFSKREVAKHKVPKDGVSAKILMTLADNPDGLSINDLRDKLPELSRTSLETAALRLFKLGDLTRLITPARCRIYFLSGDKDHAKNRIST